MSVRSALRCQMCPGHGVSLGRVGRLRRYRRRGCGMDFNRPARPLSTQSQPRQREGVRLG
jgi:hypothetical protein